MLDEGQRTTDIEPGPSATFGDQSQDLRLVREAAAQQNQPGLEVVLDIRQLEALVESNLAVRELDALLAVVDLRVGPTCLDCSDAARLRRRVICAVASVFGLAGRLGRDSCSGSHRLGGPVLENRSVPCAIVNC